MKATLFALDFGELDPSIRLHKYYRRHNNFMHINTFASSTAYKLTIVRDPFRRFISLYRQLIVNQQYLLYERGTFLKLRLMGLPAVPNLDTFASSLSQYMRASWTIYHHARPQTLCLAGNRSLFDAVVPLEDVDRINAILSKLADRPVELTQRNRTTQKANLPTLSDQALQTFLSVYGRDYELLGDYYDPPA